MYCWYQDYWSSQGSGASDPTLLYLTDDKPLNLGNWNAEKDGELEKKENELWEVEVTQILTLESDTNPAHHLLPKAFYVIIDTWESDITQ